MKTICAITCSDPVFLKTVYPRSDVDLIDHEREVPSRGKFITFEGSRDWKWRVWRMTVERVPIPIGVYPSLPDAIFAARK